MSKSPEALPSKVTLTVLEMGHLGQSCWIELAPVELGALLLLTAVDCLSTEQALTHTYLQQLPLPIPSCKTDGVWSV